MSIRTDKNIISRIVAEKQIVYRPSLKAVTGSTNGAILLQQISYWWYVSGEKPFYKFLQSCQNALYKDGDSWVEELEFSYSEIQAALEKFALKIVSGTKKSEAIENYPVIYWTDSNRTTWWQFNPDTFERLYSEAIQLKANSPKPNSGKVNYLVTSKTPITYETDETPITFITETTTENNTENNIYNIPKTKTKIKVERTSGTLPMSADGQRMKDFAEAFKRLFKIELSWTDENNGKKITGRWAKFLSWAKKENITAAHLEYAYNSMLSEFAWCTTPQPTFIQTNWPRLIEGYGAQTEDESPFDFTLA